MARGALTFCLLGERSVLIQRRIVSSVKLLGWVVVVYVKCYVIFYLRPRPRTPLFFASFSRSALPCSQRGAPGRTRRKYASWSTKTGHCQVAPAWFLSRSY